MIVCKDLKMIFPHQLNLSMLDEMYKKDRDARIWWHTEDGKTIIFLSIPLKFWITYIKPKTDIEMFIEKYDESDDRADMRFFYKNHCKKEMTLTEFKWVVSKKFWITFTS